MPRGASDIPELRLVRLQRLIEMFMMSPSLVLSKLWGEIPAESDSIKWEGMIGTRGMTPFVAPGAKAPQVEPVGISQHSATAAFWKEKMYLDEVFLNNLRRPGTTQQHWAAKNMLARNLKMMRNRCDRRKEWMYAKMITAGSFTYTDMKGIRFTVDYGIPSNQIVTLAASRLWSTGANANIVEDIFDAKLAVRNSVGAELNYALLTTEVLKYMFLNTSIQTLLKKSAFGNGDLFARPVAVLSNLLNIDNMILYDEQYQLKAWLTAAVTGGSTTTIYVDDATDFEVGGVLRFHDISADTWEEETISAVDVDAGTITVSTAPTASFKASEDCVTMTKKFLPTDKFVMFSDSVQGTKIAEFFNAPFGLTRTRGMKVDSHPEWDPEGMWIRVQNKGLPVLYQRDGVYILTVA
jgi:hypothetical protein